MSEGVPEVPGMAEAEPVGEGAERSERIERLAGADPFYERALVCVQQGRWEEAQEALGELQARYPGSVAVQAVQEALMLHLSAERSWGPEAQRRAMAAAPKTLSLRMRVLIVANLVLYILIVLVWLLVQIKRLLG